MADRLGTQVGNYRLTHLLGQGGFAEVYLGEHIHLGTQAAIKLLHAPLSQAPQVEAFRQEARRIAQLSHQHIIRVLEFGFEGELPYLVLEYAPGGSLRQRHPVGTPVPLATVMSYVQQIAPALQYAHDEQIIHRDIKPQNLLLGRRGEILLSDFGISVVAESTSRQQTREFAGTASYAAPEQIQGHPRPASDQYALAVVVYEWLTGKLPFTGALLEVLWKQAHTPPPALRQYVSSLSPAVEEVVLTALVKDPKERFASVQAFATALLQASQAGEPSTILSPVVGVWSATPTASPASAPVFPKPGDWPAGAIGAAPPPPLPALSPGGNPAPRLEASMRSSGVFQQVHLPLGRSSARSSPLLADGETKRAKMWTPVFTRTFLALFLVGTVLGGWARIVDGFWAFHNPNDGIPIVYNRQDLSPPFVVLLFLCEGFLVIFPLVGLRMITSKLMRVGLLLQAGIGGVSLLRSLLEFYLHGYYDLLTQKDLVYLEYRWLPLVMSVLLALSVLCFSYELAPWRFPSDLGWTLLQVVGSAVGGVLVLNAAIRTGIYALIQGAFSENAWGLVLATGTFATFAFLVVLLRPACWKRSWSLTIGLALGGGGVMLLLTLGFYVFIILPDDIYVSDYPTFFVPYILMALACILVVRSERLHQNKLTKQTTF